MSIISITSYVNCPFSLCISQADLIDRVLGDRTTGGFRPAFRGLAFPLAGSMKQSVTVWSRMRLHLSEPGRFHDEIVFDVNAQPAWIPKVSGTLRFRVVSPGAQLLFVATYSPPFAVVGRILDRLVARRIAVSIAREFMGRLVCELERTWTERQVVHHAPMRQKPVESLATARGSA